VNARGPALFAFRLQTVSVREAPFLFFFLPWSRFQPQPHYTEMHVITVIYLYVETLAAKTVLWRLLCVALRTDRDARNYGNYQITSCDTSHQYRWLIRSEWYVDSLFCLTSTVGLGERVLFLRVLDLRTEMHVITITVITSCCITSVRYQGQDTIDWIRICMRRRRYVYTYILLEGVCYVWGGGQQAGWLAEVT